MKKSAFGLVSAIALAAAPAAAADYVYVGSWVLGEGVNWTTNPPVYSGREAAELLFGPSASGYVISTIDSDPNNINFSAWLDGWSDPDTYARNGTPAADTFSLDTGGNGYNSNPGFGSAYSAYVQDHFDGSDTRFTNFAFRVVGQGAVPEPGTWAMMLLGFGFVGGAMRSGKRRQKVNVSYA